MPAFLLLNLVGATHPIVARLTQKRRGKGKGDKNKKLFNLLLA
jgi:hypothetical protein